MTENEVEWIREAGAKLKSERISSGKSLDEIAAAIKLSVSQIEAIENCRTDKLPPLVYTKGFIRVYAAYLGLSGYEPQKHERSDIIENQAVKSENLKKQPIVKKLTLPFILFLFILILSVFYNNDPSPQKKELPANIAESKAPENLPVQQRLSSPSNDIVNKNEKMTTAETVNEPAKEGFSVLKLKITQDCWLRITIDDAPPQEYTLKAGDTISWKAASRIVLDIGNAGGVEGDFNGKPLVGLGESGEVVHLTLDAASADSAADN